ncbi:MAG: glycosyltransferase [Clostridium sp.]|nr:glycosyltransferase [Clostridium sp.]
MLAEIHMLMKNVTEISNHNMQFQIPISVCLPVYNGANYIEKCLESVLSQTFSDYEIIIGDDGSNDNTIDIIRNINDSRIRIIRNSHNYTDTLNLLLNEARGKYIARLDADDLMLPDRLAIQYNFMESNPDIDILGASVQLFGEQAGTIIRHGSVELVSLINNNCIVNPTAFMRTERIKSVSLQYEEEYIYAEDYMFWVRALKNGLRIYNIDDIVLKYRVSCSQVSATYSAIQQKQTEKIQAEILQWLTCKEANWAKSHPVVVPQTDNKLTVIIPFLNEKEEVCMTVRSIRETVGYAVDIIVINDQSYDSYDYRRDLRDFSVIYVYNKNRLGVAQSRDLGVSLCKTPYFLLLDAHMRFYDSNWANTIVEKLENNDRCLLCCQTDFLKKDASGNVYVCTECPRTFGARIQFDKKNLWPDIDWKYNENCSGIDVEPIPAVLGAGYAASTRYWKYIRGLNGLHYYGSDESYISLKVWLEGGQCLLLKHVVIGHIYRDASPFRRYNEEEIYNGLMIAYTLFPGNLNCMAHAIAICKNRSAYWKAVTILKQHQKELDGLKEYYKDILTVPFKNIVKLHEECNAMIETIATSCVEHADEFYTFLLQNMPQAYGLYEGKTAALIWLCMYSRYTQTDVAMEHIGNIIVEIQEAIEQGEISWNFGYGVAGIGWALLYLYNNGYLSDISFDLLCKIDDVICQLDIEKLPSEHLSDGISGILAYLSLRKGMTDYNTCSMNHSKIEEKADNILNTSTNVSECYYALSFLSKDMVQSVTPNINEWLECSIFLPKEKCYWNTSLHKGCIGAFVKSFIYLLKK